MQEEVSYLCPVCGEDIVTTVDVSQGDRQEYVEDCPVCCSPISLRVEINLDGEIDCEATAD